MAAGQASDEITDVCLSDTRSSGAGKMSLQSIEGFAVSANMLEVEILKTGSSSGKIRPNVASMDLVVLCS